MSFNGNKLNMSQIRALEGPQTDDLNPKKKNAQRIVCLCAEDKVVASVLLAS